jgi:HEAT repeat protein
MKKAIIGILMLGLIITPIGNSVGMGQKPETEEIMEANEEARKEYLAKQEEEREKLKKKVPELIEKLKTAKGFKRERIILELGRSRDPRAVKALANVVLVDTDIKIRSFAIERVGLLGYYQNEDVTLKEALDDLAVPALKTVLDNENLEVKTAEALYRLGEKSLARPILLKRGSFGVLVDAGDEAVVPYLKAGLRSEDPSERLVASYSLIDFNEISLALPVLEDIVKRCDDKFIRASAIGALEKINTEKALSIIESALKDEDPYVRREAKKAIKKMRGK